MSFSTNDFERGDRVFDSKYAKQGDIFDFFEGEDGFTYVKYITDNAAVYETRVDNLQYVEYKQVKFINK